MTNITEEHRRVFDALTGGPPGRFCLFSCFCGGEPAAAIASVTVCPPEDDIGEAEYVIPLLFISLTPGMTLTDHNGTTARAAIRSPADQPISSALASAAN
ncbi:MAG: hypothetical protein OXI15_20370 [Chromatiales bacterium]|nr:hypothetical protein [Chromatiales bacterium]